MLQARITLAFDRNPDPNPGGVRVGDWRLTERTS
jgi:hypothetical protein